MILGVVVGTVVATRKEAELASLKFLLVKPCDAAGQPLNAAPVVAVDAVGAGVIRDMMAPEGREQTATRY